MFDLGKTQRVKSGHNGDGRADFQIEVQDVNVLRAGDFVL